LSLAKLKGFVQIIQEEEREIVNIEEALGKIHLFAKKSSPSHLKVLSQRVDTHFDHLVKTLGVCTSYRSTTREQMILHHYLKTIHQLQDSQKMLKNRQSSLAWTLANWLDQTARKIPYLSKLKKYFHVR
jgi:hypothetical protein